MFSEQNEILGLFKRKVTSEELVMFSTPENINNFDRTLLLFSKANKTQRLAALAKTNLIALVDENANRFGTEILPVIYREVDCIKDPELVKVTADSLEAVADLKLVRSKYMLAAAEKLISHICFNNKKQFETVWSSLIVKILKLYVKRETAQKYVDEAFEMSDSQNNQS